jgi:hypothetical protein
MVATDRKQRMTTVSEAKVHNGLNGWGGGEGVEEQEQEESKNCNSWKQC